MKRVEAHRVWESNGSYWTGDPNGEVGLNTSKETTIRELTSIDGIPEEVFRMQNMGLSAGHVNAVDYCTQMFGFPEHREMLIAFMEDMKNEPFLLPK